MTLNRIVFMVGDLRSFFSHRFSLALDLEGYFGAEIIVIFFDNSDPSYPKEEACNFKFIHIPLSRGAMNPVKDIIAIGKISRVFFKLKPDIVHLVTIKPYLYGGIAARLTAVPAVISAVSGLGSLFLTSSLYKQFILLMLRPLFHCAFNHKNQKVIFQNREDLNYFHKLRLIKNDCACLIPGMGVDLKYFHYKREPIGKIVVSFVGRILGDKGIREFIRASEICYAQNSNIEFRVWGSTDIDNPSSIPESELRLWRARGIVRFMGHSSNVRESYWSSHIICLPSYREGFPKVAMEAAAVGRPLITSDAPGCRDAVIHGFTGYSVPVRAVDELASVILQLCNSVDLRVWMSNNARRYAEANFDSDAIVEMHKDLYEGLMQC